MIFTYFGRIFFKFTKKNISFGIQLKVGVNVIDVYNLFTEKTQNLKFKQSTYKIKKKYSKPTQKKANKMCDQQNNDDVDTNNIPVRTLHIAPVRIDVSAWSIFNFFFQISFSSQINLTRLTNWFIFNRFALSTDERTHQSVL